MVNQATAGLDYHMPFGGSKKSPFCAREQVFAAAKFFNRIKCAYAWS